MSKRYVVRLSEEERKELQSLVKKGTVKAYRVKHANILLKADANGPGWTDEKIAEAFGCHFNTVVQVRRRFGGRGTGAGLGPQEATATLAREVTGRRARGANDRTQLRPATGRTSPLDAATAQPTAGGDGDRGDDQPRNGAPGFKKKRPQTALEEVLGDPAPAGMRTSWPIWKTFWKFTSVPWMGNIRWCAWTSSRSS